jgi:hypothetical protein
MDNLVRIGNADISIKEYKGERVVTFKDIDMVHERPDGTARHRFAENKKHFVEGEDYFVLKPSDLENTELDGFRPVGIDTVSPRGTALITEQGYLMLVKSFTDDLAWEVQKKLVSSYFNVYFRMRLEHCSRVRNQILRMKGSDCMSEKEKRVVEKLRDAIPNMTDFQKGYVLGMVESSASKHSEQGEENETHNGKEN